MINIILPLASFLITLALAMSLIGFLQRNNTNKISTKMLVLILLVPFILLHCVGFMVRARILLPDVYPFALTFYFVIPLVIFFFMLKRSVGESSIYSLIVLTSAFFSGFILAFFIGLLD